MCQVVHKKIKKTIIILCIEMVKKIHILLLLPQYCGCIGTWLIHTQIDRCTVKSEEPMTDLGHMYRKSAQSYEVVCSDK